MRALLFFTIAFASLCGSAHAAPQPQWWMLAANTQTVLYVDTASLTPKGKVRSAWVRMQFSPVRPDGVKYMTLHMSVDCQDKSYWVPEAGAGLTDGSTQSIPGDTKRERSSDNTYLASALTFICEFDPARTASMPSGFPRKLGNGPDIEQSLDLITRIQVMVKKREEEKTAQ